MPEVGAVLDTKENNFKDIFQNLQEIVLQYVVSNYKKVVDLDTLIIKLEDFYLSSKKPIAPTLTRNRVPTEISKKIY